MQQLGIGRSGLFHHLVQESCFVCQQIMRMIEFDHLASVHYEHFVGIHHRVQTVSDCQYRTHAEFVSNCILNQRVGSGKITKIKHNRSHQYYKQCKRWWNVSIFLRALLWIDIGSRFVQHQNFVLLYNGSSQTHQLPLTNA